MVIFIVIWFGFGSVHRSELRGSAKPPNLTEPSSSAEPEPERFGRSLNALQAVKKHVITLPL